MGFIGKSSIIGRGVCLGQTNVLNPKAGAGNSTMTFAIDEIVVTDGQGEKSCFRLTPGYKKVIVAKSNFYYNWEDT